MWLNKLIYVNTLRKVQSQSSRTERKKQRFQRFVARFCYIFPILSSLTRELRACARASCRYDVGNGTRSLARLVDSCKLFFDFNEMATFVAKNSGGVKKKPVIILKYFFFRFGFNKRRQRLAGMGVRLRTKSIVTYRIVCFSCVKQQKMPATYEITT